MSLDPAKRSQRSASANHFPRSSGYSIACRRHRRAVARYASIPSSPWGKQKHRA